MIEDTTLPHGYLGSSWAEFTSTVTGIDATANNSRTNHALIVYQNADPNQNEPVVSQLLVRARVILPAVMNYLYFSSAQVAVVYFGKRVERGASGGEKKIGISEGAEDFKIRMIRYLTSEIWPPLLRTDAPDESLGNDYLHAGRSVNHVSIEGLTQEQETNMREVAQERSWFKKSLDSDMQVLLYLKNGINDTKYLKVLLNNSAHRLHFDVIDAREEKYRWDLRMLFTRMLDNLETQKAIGSYESYVQHFCSACDFSARHASDLEHSRKRLLVVNRYEVPNLSKCLLTPSAAHCCKKVLVVEGNGKEEATSECNEHTKVRMSQSASQSNLGPSGLPFTPILPVPSSVSSARLTSTNLDPALDTSAPTARALVSPPSLLSFDVLHGTADLPTPASTHVRTVKETRRTPPPPPLRVTSSPPIAQHCFCSTANSNGERRFYRWMESLNKPESARLDYKSYFSYTAQEIKHRSVKFMSGFLNAYGEGKLVIGVHEIQRRDLDGKPMSEKDGKNTIVTHNDRIDQFVVGVRITEEQLKDVQHDVSQQLLCCVPPVPPELVHVSVIPVVFPPGFMYAKEVLVLFDDGTVNNQSRDALKQKSNFLVRWLSPLGLSIVPLALVDDDLEEYVRNAISDPESINSEYFKAEAYVIAAIEDPVALKQPHWMEDLNAAFRAHKSRCRHAFIDFEAVTNESVDIPPLYVVEVSVDIKRCTYKPLRSYEGKFFSGWPSIPIWDPTTMTVRAMERNYNIFNMGLESTHIVSTGSHASSTLVTPGVFNQTPSTITAGNTAGTSSGEQGSGAAGASALRRYQSASFQRSLVRNGWVWYTVAQIPDRILSFLYNPAECADILQFRLIHPVCNRVFENRQGTHWVNMLCSTHVGVPVFTTSHEHVSRMQFSFLHAGIPPLPLLVCRIYEIIGNLPSPYPFVSVPICQQSFRLSRYLIPLYFHQHYLNGQQRLALVLDLRDGIIKTVNVVEKDATNSSSSGSSLVLLAVVGIGFEKMSRLQVKTQLERQRLERQLWRRRKKKKNKHKACDPPFNIASPIEVEEEEDERETIVNDRWSFLARRSAQLNASQYASHPLMQTPGYRSSSMRSPITYTDTGATIQREVEANMPIIHFEFLTKAKVGKLCSPATSFRLDQQQREKSGVFWGDESVLQRTMGKPWSLQHLLAWCNSLTTDTDHSRFFGYCERSIAFHIHSLSEVCEEHLEPYAADESMLYPHEHFKFAQSPVECKLHKKMHEWMSV